MEPFQPFLIALLAVVMATSLALLIRTRRERRQRRQEQEIIDAAAPRMQSRLSAIADPSLPPEPEPPHVPYVPVAAGHPIPTVAEATISRRWVRRDASAALIAVASIGLLVAIAAPGLGALAPVAGGTPAPSPVPTRIAITIPTDPPSLSPSPSLPLTAISRPIASFTCSHRAGLRVAFRSTSETWGEPATYHWDFGGDGSSSVADPKHRFSKPGGYDVSLVVSNSAGRSDAFTLHVHPDHGDGAIKHGRCPGG